MLNLYALNAAGLNSSAGHKVQYGFAQADASAAVSASASVCVYLGAECQAHAEITAAPTRITFATASVTGVAGFVVTPSIDRFVDAAAQATASFVADALKTALPVADLSCRASLSASADALAYARASLEVSAETSAIGRAILRGRAQCATTASLEARATHSIAARPEPMVGRCTCKAAGGWVLPAKASFTAELYASARARQAHTAGAELMGRVLIAARSVSTCLAKATFQARAELYSTPAITQGAVYGMGGTARLDAEAEYWFMSHAAMPASADATAHADLCLSGEARPRGTARLHGEPKINNIHYAFVSSEASAHMSFLAQGIVVAPIVVHFFGTSSMVPDAAYVHRAKATATVAADALSAATRYRMGCAEADVSASVLAEAHYRWDGAAQPTGKARAEGFARQKHVARASTRSTANVVANCTWIQHAHAHCPARADFAATGERHKMGEAEMHGQAELTAARPLHDHAGRADMAASGLVLAEAHWLWLAGATTVSFAEMEADPSQGHEADAGVAAWCDVHAAGLIVHDAGASMDSFVDLGADATHVHMAGCDYDMTAELEVLSIRTQMAESASLCAAAMTAEYIGNPDADDHSGRVMLRPFVDRNMYRPFVDRTMNTTPA